MIADLSNKLIESHSKIKSVNQTISNTLTNKMLLKKDKVSTEISVAGTNLSDSRKLTTLLEKLELAALTNDEAGKVGLGTSNIMSMACELLLNKGGFSSFLLIEEPEAHIHAQRQLRLMQSLEEEVSEGNHQIIITTHSPLLASAVKLENITIINKHTAFSLAKKETKLSSDDYLFLERYLDATKANLFFAKGVVIVEGPSEELLLPTISRIIEKDFSKHGISLVNSRGIGLMKICGIGISITDSDIDEIEQILGNVSFDSERRDIIKRLDTFDVQAYPGTGKTTLLVAKLAILAKKWPFTHKGICVLSHTNVAREEIESRLGNTELGRKLLSYPHFIGTIHSFADTFIGIPFLRSNNKPVVMIDTESTLERRYNLLSPGSQSYFARKHLSSNNCESTAYPIQIDIKCAETTSTYHNVFSVVESSINRGFYTFNEMLFISKHALSVIPSMSGIIQRRFPVLMIDEAQDTSELQWEIIMLAFPDKQDTIVERFGDANQAIYHSYQASINSSQYPKGEVLSVNGSLRFGKEIAALADPLSTDFSGMEGKSTQFSSNSNHTIILFEKSKASEVFSIFGEIVLETFSDTELVRYSSFGVHAIGMVHNKDKTDMSEPSYPASLCDYYNSYMPSLAKKSGNPSFVIDYFRRKESSQSLSEAIEWVAKGIRFYINNSTLIRISYRKNDWYSLLSEIDPEQQLAFRKEFQRLLSLNCSTESEWGRSAKELMSFCEKWFDAELQNPRSIMWTDGEPEQEDKLSSNTIRYIGKSGRTADILLGSIHSEKGRTHLATLVLDTFWYDRNIISILPWVTGNKKQGRIGERDLKRLRCHYVAFTRPRGLLCVAIPFNTISADTIDSLQKHGWKIKMIE